VLRFSILTVWCGSRRIWILLLGTVWF